MNFVLSVVCLWVGAAMLFLAVHQGEDNLSSPWDAYSSLIARIRGGAGATP